jgi:hypothetical protein
MVDDLNGQRLTVETGPLSFGMLWRIVAGELALVLALALALEREREWE